MRPARALALAFAGLVASGLAAAGGPLATNSNGQPFTWAVGSTIQYRTDGGRLSALVDQDTARGRVASMFQVWEDVASAALSYNRQGPIQNVGVFTDGDVSTAAEYDAVEGACNSGAQSPIVFDVDGSLFEDLGQDSSVIGFAGPCAINGNGEFASGQAVMNGIYRDGIDNVNNPEINDALFDAAFVHEFGHFSGLDHSQINVECATGCSADDLAGLPTMFPFLVSQTQSTLSIDDVAWISRLHPAGGGAGFAATHGTITGTVYFSDGESHLQYANVIARRVDAGGNEPRRFAVSTVSGYRFRACTPNTITNPDPDFCPPSGSLDPAHIGLYEIPVPPGSYTIEVEVIDPSFTDGSSVGPSDRPIAMPGTAPAPLGPVTIAAGQTSSGNDIVLIGTPPRFDQFEGS
jgi:hypothetical protein